MPQTRFVTLKALKQGLKPIVVVNKVDRPGARPEWVVNQTFDLFDRLGASDDAARLPGGLRVGAQRLGDARRQRRQERACARTPTPPCSRCSRPSSSHVPAPAGDVRTAPLQFQVSALDYSSYLGRLGIGRIRRGTLQAGPGSCRAARSAGRGRDRQRRRRSAGAGVRGTRARSGDRAPQAGDIVLVTGIDDLTIGTTLTRGRRARSAAADHRRRADAVDVLPGQHVAARRPRGQVRDVAQPARAAATELLVNMALRVEETGDTDVVPRLGPRRAASDHPDREHAPRRLRARGVAAARRACATIDGES